MNRPPDSPYHRRTTLLTTLILIAMLWGSCERQPDSVALTRQGRLAAERGEHEKAQALFRSVLANDPEAHDARLGLGRSFEDTEDFVSAIEVYQEVLKRKPKHVIAHMYLGNAYRRLGEFEKAVEAIQAAIKLAPGEAWVHHLLGQVKLQTGERRQAEKSFQEAIRLVPNDAEFRLSYGELLDSEKRYSDALVHYREYVSLVSGLPKYQETERQVRARIQMLSEEGFAADSAAR